MLNRVFFIIMSSLLLFNCVARSAMAKPDEAMENEVRDCKFLTTVVGNSGYGKQIAWQPHAKADAIQRASKLGATHIVWRDFRDIGAFNGAVTARTYECP
jgi:hypothetical protein